ncbi:immunity 22 family protein [Paenibacillus sp. S-38]|uniref:immunity 22 family protein n=1 Tax=Paenibacillus sp. S-38 TaxID=3416710 RepID=UPI003CEC1530
MEKDLTDESRVSLWLGSWSLEEAVQAYVEGSYTEEGDYVPSPFENDFALRYDPDFIELQYREAPAAEWASLLGGHSYDEELISAFAEEIGPLDRAFNTVILVYNLAYDGEHTLSRTGAGELVYIGQVEYRGAF